MSGSQTGPSGPNDPVEPDGLKNRAAISPDAPLIYAPREQRGAPIEEVIAEGGDVEHLEHGERPADPAARWEEPELNDLQENHE
jgi:hypothetical protein